MEKSLRYNEDKPKWSLVHYKSLEPMVRVLEMGAKKYSEDNWKIGLNRSEILESTMRHLTALMDGELLDKESGISHMAHIQCNAMFYNYHEANNSFTKGEIISTTYNHVSASTIAPTPYEAAMHKLADQSNESTWSERKKATFKFFNEFPEPYRTQAKDSYDEKFVPEIPENKMRALHGGFDWDLSKQGRDYWAIFRDALERALENE